MNIDIDKNISQLKEYNESQNELKIHDLKEYIYQIICLLANQIDCDISKINEVQIIPSNENLGFLGKTAPILKNDILFFDLIFTDEVINWIIDDKNKQYNHAIEVIAHELYHCEEMLITSQYINYKKIYFYNGIDTTYDLILNFAKKQFSEYYAYYYSSNYFLLNTNCTFKKVINDSSIALYVLSDNAKDNLKVILPESFFEKIESFIYTCVKYLAKYHFTNDEKYLHIFDEYKDNQMYYLHYKHYLWLNSFLKETFTLYPQKMSEDFLISYGKNLLSIFKLYSLDYSTDDLSDNFILKYIK